MPKLVVRRRGDRLDNMNRVAKRFTIVAKLVPSVVE